MLGLLIAFFGVFLGHQLNNPYFDGGASILIGLLLVSVAIVLARESKSLLMGEGVNAATQQQLIKLAEADPAVQNVVRTATIYRGPQEIALVQDVVFRADMTTTDISAAIQRIHRSIQAQFPAIKQPFTQPVALPDNENAA